MTVLTSKTFLKITNSYVVSDEGGASNYQHDVKLEIKTEKTEPVTPRRPRPSFNSGSPATRRNTVIVNNSLDRQVGKLATSVNKVGGINGN